MTATVPVSDASVRVQDIAQKIRGAVTPFIGANDEKVSAQKAATAAGDAETSLREHIMTVVAELSQQGQWTESEIKVAAAKAASMSNNKEEGALAVFIGETKRAMHPNNRSHVSALITLCDAMWKAEKAAGDDTLRKAFQRKYHMLIQLLAQGEEGKLYLDQDSITRFAETRDPNLDVKKVLARLERIRKQLEEFHKEWPVSDIAVCIEALAEIDKKALKASRPAPAKVETPAPTPPAPVVTAPVVPVNTAPVSEPEPAVAEGAVDVLEDVLKG